MFDKGKNKIVVSGGSGFVGSHTCRALREKGYSVLNFDLTEGYDIRDFEQLCSFIKPGDKILHLAAVARFVEADAEPERAWTTNVEGTDCVARAAKKCGAERVVYSSTGSVYMPVDEKPPITEAFQVRGNSVYGVSKHFGELAIKRSGVPYIILRYGHLFGEGKVGHGLVGGFVSRMERGLAPTLYGGKQSNDMCYIKDVVQANILALETDNLNEIYNVGTGEEMSVEQTFKILQDFFGYTKELEILPARSVDPIHFVYDISKAREKLGYEPKYTFLEGMSDWFKNGKPN